jgi:hypothetical protein
MNTIFKNKKLETYTGLKYFFTAVITEDNISNLVAKTLSDDIENCARMDSGSTIYLDIQTLTIPAVVIEAIKKLGGFGAGIVVSHNGLYTNDTNSKIDEKLLNFVQKAARSGVVWHPREEIWVQAVTKL